MGQLYLRENLTFDAAKMTISEGEENGKKSLYI